jgi:hypothetical protein
MNRPGMQWRILIRLGRHGLERQGEDGIDSAGMEGLGWQ